MAEARCGREGSPLLRFRAPEPAAASAAAGGQMPAIQVQTHAEQTGAHNKELALVQPAKQGRDDVSIEAGLSKQAAARGRRQRRRRQ